MPGTQHARLAVFIQIPDAKLAPDIVAVVLPDALAFRIDGRLFRHAGQLIDQRPAKVQALLFEAIGQEDRFHRRGRDFQLDQEMIGAAQIRYADQSGAGLVHGAEADDIRQVLDPVGQALEGHEVMSLQEVL